MVRPRSESPVFCCRTKTRTERKGAPTFTALVEVLSWNKWRLHLNVAASVDAMLEGKVPYTQLRWVEEDGRMMVRMEGPRAQGEGPPGATRAAAAAAALERCPPGGGAWLAQLANMATLY